MSKGAAKIGRILFNHIAEKRKELTATALFDLVANIIQLKLHLI